MFPTRLTSACALLSALFALPSLAAAATFTVTRNDDPLAVACVPGDCSLREAVEAAAAQPGPHRILLPNNFLFMDQGPLAFGNEVVLEGHPDGGTSIGLTVPEPTLQVTDGEKLELRNLLLYGNSAVLVEVSGGASLRLDRVTQLESQRFIAMHPDAQVDFSAQDSYLAGMILCNQRSGTCTVERSRIGSLAAGGAESTVDVHLRSCTIMGALTTNLLLSGLIVNGRAALSVEGCVIRDSLRPLALYQAGAVGEAPPVTVRRTRFLDNRGPIRGSRQGVVELEEVLLTRHVVDPDSGLSADYTQAPSVLLADEGPDWRILRSAIHHNTGVAPDGRTILLNPGAQVLLENVYFEHNTRPASLPLNVSDGIGVYAGPGQPPRLRIVHGSILRSNLMQPGGPGPVFGVRGPVADVRFDNSIVIGDCAFQSGAAGPAGQGNVTSETSCGLDMGINITNVPPDQMNLRPAGYWGGFTPSRPPTSFSTAVAVANPDYCTPVDQRGAPRPANGIACDVGSVQHEVEMPMFSSGFE